MRRLRKTIMSWRQRRYRRRDRRRMRKGVKNRRRWTW